MITEGEPSVDMERYVLMRELKRNREQESLYLPKEAGLNLIESNSEVNQPEPSSRITQSSTQQN